MPLPTLRLAVAFFLASAFVSPGVTQQLSGTAGQSGVSGVSGDNGVSGVADFTSLSGGSGSDGSVGSDCTFVHQET